LAPLPGSPAIDGGGADGCPKTDQRGITRPQGAACDIGAFEYVAPPPPVAPPCARVVSLPARLRARARSFDVLVGGKVVAARRRPRQHVAIAGVRRAVVRVHLRN